MYEHKAILTIREHVPNLWSAPLYVWPEGDHPKRWTSWFARISHQGEVRADSLGGRMLARHGALSLHGLSLPQALTGTLETFYCMPVYETKKSTKGHTPQGLYDEIFGAHTAEEVMKVRRNLLARTSEDFWRWHEELWGNTTEVLHNHLGHVDKLSLVAAGIAARATRLAFEAGQPIALTPWGDETDYSDICHDFCPVLRKEDGQFIVDWYNERVLNAETNFQAIFIARNMYFAPTYHDMGISLWRPDKDRYNSKYNNADLFV